MSITVEFDSEQEVQRILFLLHRDLARVVGNQVLAQEQLEAHDAKQIRLSGRMRKRAVQVVETTPEQEAVLRKAQKALRDGLKKVQKGRE